MSRLKSKSSSSIRGSESEDSGDMRVRRVGLLREDEETKKKWARHAVLPGFPEHEMPNPR